MMSEKAMTPDEFIHTVRSHADGIVALLQQKNTEYAGNDPLKCFRKRGLLGLLIRLEDKLNRYDTFVEQNCATPEMWQELLGDIVGYGLLGLVLIAEGEAGITSC